MSMIKVIIDFVTLVTTVEISLVQFFLNVITMIFLNYIMTISSNTFPFILPHSHNTTDNIFASPTYGPIKYNFVKAIQQKTS